MRLTQAFAAMVVLSVAALTLAAAAFTWALRSAEATAAGRAHGTLAGAAVRLADAYATQIAPLQSGISAPLPPHTIDSFGSRVVSAALRSDEGVTGGYVVRGAIVAASSPVRTDSERSAILRAADAARIRRSPAVTTLDLADGRQVAVDAAPLAGAAGVAWAMRTVSEVTPAGTRGERVWIAAAAACALGLALAGVAVVGAIRRDARSLLSGIDRLAENPAARIVRPSGDFGVIADAINAMADSRGRAEVDARRSERLAAIGRLAANAAHEIRNPLNSLRLQVAVLRRRAGPALDEPAAKLEAEIDRLNAVVSGMLAVGAGGVAPRETVDLCEVARAAVALYGDEAALRGRGMRLSCAEPALVHGDARRLEQLALNLISNAVDAAPVATEVEVAVDPGPVLRVIDLGGPIPGAEMRRIFEPFHSTKPDGSGLGLAIAYEIATAHGARIDVTSIAGRTEFSVDFRDRSVHV